MAKPTDKEKGFTEKFEPQRDIFPDVNELMKKERAVSEKIDKEGNRWKKVYFGGGSHFTNWLNQYLEIYGDENIEVEEPETSVCECYKEGGEKMKRIWVKEKR